MAIARAEIFVLVGTKPVSFTLAACTITSNMKVERADKELRGLSYTEILEHANSIECATTGVFVKPTMAALAAHVDKAFETMEKEALLFSRPSDGDRFGAW